jgi:hypothetical protein
LKPRACNGLQAFFIDSLVIGIGIVSFLDNAYNRCQRSGYRCRNRYLIGVAVGIGSVRFSGNPGGQG